MKRFLLSFFIVVSLATLRANSLCEHERFDIVIGSKVSFYDILDRISKQCLLSVVFEDSSAKDILKQKDVILNFSQKPLEYVLKSGFDALNLNYRFDGSTIYISRLETQTFKLHHISTSREALSSTNVVFSQDSNKDGYNLESDKSQNQSGSQILSKDSVDFWGNLKDKLDAIVYREYDGYVPTNEKGGVVIDRSSGLITITGLKSQIARAAKYISELNDTLSKQVLIDVNILTVTHQNKDTTGINWQALFELGGNNSGQESIIKQDRDGLSFNLGVFANNFSLSKIVQFLKKYGTVNTLSNPKILSLNNQPALISVGNILRYQQNKIFQSNSSQTTVQNTEQTFPSVFAGVLLDITPTIQGDDIILKINPSVTSTKDGNLEDKFTALAAPPNLSTNQLSSIIKLKDNQKVVLGGLISRTSVNEVTKVPLLGDIPLLSYFFTYNETVDQTKEMVLIITAKLI